MIFYIKNLGKIQKSKFDIRDFTVFVGKNNTNKTWVAYLIYAIASERINRIFTYHIIRKKRKDAKVKKGLINFTYSLKQALKHAKSLQEEITEGKEGRKDTYTFIKGYLKRTKHKHEEIVKVVIKEYSKFLENYAYKVLGVDRELLRDLKLRIKLEEEKVLDKILKKVEDVKFSDVDGILLTDVLQVSSLIFKSIIGEPFNLPSERKGLILFLNLINLGERNRDEIEDYLIDMVFSEKFNYEKYREMITPFKSFMYSYPEPLLDFKDFLSKIPNYKEKEESLNKELSDLLEASILEGRLEVSADTNTISYKTEGGITLNIVNTSSMIKGLSALDLYIKYKMKAGDLIIIDEPEMNLHPEAQVRLTEFLAILVNKGVKVLITTHSPYIIDHTINLIAGYSSENKEKNKLFWQTNYIKKGKYKNINIEDIYLDINKLSVYLFEDDGTVKDIIDKKEETINWDTFGKISEKVSYIYWEL